MESEKLMTAHEVSRVIYEALNSSDPTGPTYKKMRIAEIIETYAHEREKVLVEALELVADNATPHNHCVIACREALAQVREEDSK